MTPIWKRLVLTLMYAPFPRAWVFYLVVLLAAAVLAPPLWIKAGLALIACLMVAYRLLEYAASMEPAPPLELVTAPDEQERCCVVRAGRRCTRHTAYRVSGDSRELDDVTYTCEECLPDVMQPGDVATRLNKDPIV